MILTDVNVLVYSFRKDADQHEEFRAWLLSILQGDSQFGLSELVLNSFVRIVTHPRIFKEPSTLKESFAYTKTLLAHPLSCSIQCGPRHWDIFQNLCKQADAKGNLITDAYLAALAIESGCEWISTDRDFARFKGLRWKHPLK